MIRIDSEAVYGIDSEAVYEHDGFAFGYTDGAYTLDWQPDYAEPRGEVIAAWARTQLASGDSKYEVVCRADIERARSRATSDGWERRPADMARRLAIRRLLKTLPVAPDLRPVKPRHPAPAPTPPANGHPVT